jgi:hypothetical protein
MSDIFKLARPEIGLNKFSNAVKISQKIQYIYITKNNRLR